MIKNTILILISILMAIFAALAIISSGYDYAAEKLFYRAMKANSRLTQHPDAALPQMLLCVETNLKKILQRYPRSRVAKNAHLALAEFYLNNHNYEQALATLYDVIKSYSQDKIVLSKAYFLRGNAFERQSQWDKALREYTILRKEYSDTPLALWVLLYIGDYYKEHNRYAEAEKTYNEATVFYKKLERKNRGKALGYAAGNLLMHAYMRLEEYDQAGRVIEEMIGAYPKLLPLTQQLSNIELVFLKKLNKPAKAIEMYRNIETKTQDPQLIKILEKKIRNLEAQQ